MPIWGAMNILVSRYSPAVCRRIDPPAAPQTKPIEQSSWDRNDARAWGHLGAGDDIHEVAHRRGPLWGVIRQQCNPCWENGAKTAR
jgi:hypothetical protein